MSNFEREIPAEFQQTMEQGAFEDAPTGCYHAWRMFGSATESNADKEEHRKSLFLTEVPTKVGGFFTHESVLSLPLAFIDIESTGRYAATDRILEIFVLKSNPVFVTSAGKTMLSEKRIRSEYHMYVNPQVNFYNTSIHGITKEFVKHRPIFPEIADQLVDELQGRVLIAHNASRFDWLILRAELRRCGIVDFAPAAIIDTLDVSRKLWKESKKHTLAALCSMLGIPQPDAHHAKIDTMTLARLFTKILEKKKHFSIGECKFVSA